MKPIILYLEDDDALANVTRRGLEKRGFEVIHFLSIKELTNQLNNFHFDHALLDLKIGNDNSLRLIKELKEKSQASIVILTGYGTIRTAVQAMKLGAINFLSKPSSIDEILKALSEKSGTYLSEETIPTFDKPSLKAVEWETIQKALDENNGNISAAARQLKMHRRTLQRKLTKRHIDF